MPRLAFPRPEPGPVQVKICGQTSLADSLACAAAGADALGFVFFDGSKRAVQFDQIAPWLDDLPGEICRVGLFVNASLAEVARVLESGKIDLAQLHGDEPPQFLHDLARAGFSGRFFKALRVQGPETLATLPAWPGKALLLDAFSPSGYGGTGHAFDWTLAATAVRTHPDRRILLAGGLTAENVAAAITAVRPAAVDVSSGVESAPGKKDPAKVQAFITAAREA